MNHAQQIEELVALLNKMDTSQRRQSERKNLSEELKRSFERSSPKQVLRNMHLA